ncbi:MAG: S8 family peptidase [Fusobacterium gastrosuis]|uniref:S8 family peptidase n=1 Tax=Fusobacterium gastrosuis TaxID=1755100 RepID=UPI002A9BD5FA|nr:S8 family peptidase [Fusobacterium gastrosuis]
MKINIAKNDIFSNYKVKLKDFRFAKQFEKLLSDYDICFKKTEYFENFFMYNLKNINSKFISILNDKAANYIMYIEPMSVYSLPIRIDEESGEVPVIYPEKNKNYVTLGILDNGLAHINYLHPWIKKVHTRFLRENTSCTHGTFVAGIALYGDKLENREIVKNEGFYLLDSTVLDSTSIEEDELLKNILLAVQENYKTVKIWNLSLSVKLEIDENMFSDFGIVLDYIQKKYSVLICKSGGNGGDFMKKRPKRKLYHGSDSLLSLVVASINNDNYSSQFSRLGLGPQGTIKPDVVSYGGELSLNEKDGSMNMNGSKSFSIKGNIASSSGTSFANARIASLATILYQNTCTDFKNFSDFDATFIKALIIHSAKNTDKNLSIEEAGFGLPENSQEILSYLKNDKIKIIRGTMTKNYSINLGGEFFEYKKNANIKCTLAYETELDYFQKEKYILSDIKIKEFSEKGENLVRKFSSNIDRRKNIELFSTNEIEKKFTIIIEKL